MTDVQRLAHNAYIRDWNAKNPDKHKRITAATYQRHKGVIKARVKAYREENKEKVAAHKKVYRETHKAEIQVKKQAEYLAQRDVIIERSKTWVQENRLKRNVIAARYMDKRRGLGSIALNEPFVGANEHHYDRLHTIWIPKELHESVRHNVWNGRNMDNINSKAFAWYTEGWT